VYVSGRVEQPGAVTLPQGSSLVQAVLACGTKVLHGKVEFIRFTREGEIDRRIFGFKSDAPASDYRNPVLMAGDVIRVRGTPLTSSLAVIGEVTTPVVGLYSVFSLFDGFGN
jgi:polysaccharide export outer membrane protein